MKHERYEQFVQRGALPLAAVLGLSAVFGCREVSSPNVEQAINCARHPGKSIEETVDMDKARSYGNLVLSGSDTFPVDVWKTKPPHHPNELSVGTSKSPVGVGGTKGDIDAYGADGMTLFESTIQDNSRPPYYTLKAIGDPGSSMVTVRLTCDQHQPRK